MKNLFALFLALSLCVSLCACGQVQEIADVILKEVENTSGETQPTIPVSELDPLLQRLQGNWAASENYEEKEPSFQCAMPATWDADMKGYYVVSIKDDQLVYKDFHKKGNNGTPGGSYDGDVYEKIYQIEEVTQQESDDYQTKLLVKALRGEDEKEFQFILYDNPDIYKNSFMLTEFADFMFVKLSSAHYASLMDIVSDIMQEKADSKELDPYIGMSKAQLENSTWGEPEDKNITELEGNYIFEQWCYPGGRYVYVENGYVCAIQK